MGEVKGMLSILKGRLPREGPQPSPQEFAPLQLVELPGAQDTFGHGHCRDHGRGRGRVAGLG